jgi:hypothetical protein
VNDGWFASGRGLESRRSWFAVAIAVAIHLLLWIAWDQDLGRNVPPAVGESLPTIAVELVAPSLLRPTRTATATAPVERPRHSARSAQPAPRESANSTSSQFAPEALPPSGRNEEPAHAEGPDPRLAAVLRGTLGCEHADFVGLSTDERHKCQERLERGVDPNRAAPLGLGAEAKEGFDLAQVENKSAHIPYAGCFARFGGGKIQWYHATRGVKVPGLPCYFVAPKGVLRPDKPPAKGF